MAYGKSTSRPVASRRRRQASRKKHLQPAKMTKKANQPIRRLALFNDFREPAKKFLAVLSDENSWACRARLDRSLVCGEANHKDPVCCGF